MITCTLQFYSLQLYFQENIFLEMLFFKHAVYVHYVHIIFKTKIITCDNFYLCNLLKICEKKYSELFFPK